MHTAAQPLKFRSRAEFAARIGVQTDTLNRYTLPDHDAEIGGRKGWLDETIDAWNNNRPGRGRWGHE